MPSWRFYRHVIRVALFLRDRLRVGLGDRVLIACSLRPERVIAEWAIVTIGAVVTYEDESSSNRAAPRRAAIVEGGFARSDDAPAEATIVVGPSAGGARSWDEALELGGTLDTAERAQTFRVGAAKLSPDAPAIELPAAEGAAVWTQADVARRLQRFSAEMVARDQDIVYFAGLGRPVSTPIPLWAFLADPRASVVLGTPGSEAEEIAEVRPSVIVGPPILRDWAVPRRASRLRQVLGRLPVVGGPISRRDRGESRLRETLTFDGLRVG